MHADKSLYGMQNIFFIFKNHLFALTAQQATALEKIFGETYHKRKIEVQQNRKYYLENEVVSKTFVIGNSFDICRFTQIGSGIEKTYTWSLFVTMEDAREDVSCQNIYFFG